MSCAGLNPTVFLSVLSGVMLAYALLTTLFIQRTCECMFNRQERGRQVASIVLLPGARRPVPQVVVRPQQDSCQAGVKVEGAEEEEEEGEEEEGATDELGEVVERPVRDPSAGVGVDIHLVACAVSTRTSTITITNTTTSITRHTSTTTI